MATIQQEITDIAVAQGYEGDAPSTIAEAVSALGSVMGGGGGLTYVDFVLPDGSNPDSLVNASMTQKKIYDAAINGQTVVGRMAAPNANSGYDYFTLGSASINSMGYSITFYRTFKAYVEGSFVSHADIITSWSPSADSTQMTYTSDI